MAHTPIEFLIDPVTGVKSITGSEAATQSVLTIKETDIDYFQSLPSQPSQHDGHEGEDLDPTIYFVFNGGLQVPILVTNEEAIKIKGFFAGKVVEVDANGMVAGGDTDGADTGADEPPELQLVQDPVIYNRPETGLSQRNVPFFKFHNPNGKSAITISMTDVDHTRFDSNSDDTHYYVVVTKARIEIRCLCTVNEQLGLEFRFRGTTHVISAEESNNVRLITESRANPE